METAQVDYWRERLRPVWQHLFLESDQNDPFDRFLVVGNTVTRSLAPLRLRLVAPGKVIVEIHFTGDTGAPRLKFVTWDVFGDINIHAEWPSHRPEAAGDDYLELVVPEDLRASAEELRAYASERTDVMGKAIRRLWSDFRK